MAFSEALAERIRQALALAPEGVQDGKQVKGWIQRAVKFGDKATKFLPIQYARAAEKRLRSSEKGI
jgi:hypothetical protein